MLISVSKQLCNKDYLCISECPVRVIRKGDDDIPFSRPEDEVRCIKCGHCIAICPKNALSLGEISPKDLPICNNKHANIPVEEVEHLIRARRTVRLFKNEAVPFDLIARALETAKMAPSAKNNQFLNWIFLKSRESVEEVTRIVVEEWMAKDEEYSMIVKSWEKGHDPIMRGAPSAVFVHTDCDYYWGWTDAACALSYLEIACHMLGLGLCWMGFVTRASEECNALNSYLKLPENHKLFGGFAMGFPKTEYHRIPLRNNPKISVI